MRWSLLRTDNRDWMSQIGPTRKITEPLAIIAFAGVCSVNILLWPGALIWHKIEFILTGKQIDMTFRLINPFAVLFIGATVVTACASTQLTSVWKDPSYQARPAKVMVIGLAKRPEIRRLFEDDFVKQLKAQGTEAIASYTVVSDKQQDNQAAIAAKVKTLGADSVLLTRLVSKKNVQVYVPGTTYTPAPYYGTWSGYYGYGYSTMYSPGYVAEDQYAVIETNLYEADTEKLVWTATSETLLGDTNQKLIASYIEVMVKAMSYNKLLGK